MTKRALVLGGGGTVGIAWETGVLNGLRSAGVDVANADLIVGTSAGSVVGTQVALGMPLDTLLAAQLAPLDEAQEHPIAVDPQYFAAVAQKLALAQDVTADLLVEIGTVALSAPTGDEEAYLQRFELLHSATWPSRRLVVTGVDAQSGEFKAWDREADAPLERAVAASCSVPGIFPPVTIGGRRYIDGGMRSGTNADLAHGYDAVLIIAPIGSQAEGMGPGARRDMEREIAQLREAGSLVDVIVPDDETLGVFGVNLMDTSRRIDAAQTGVRQGTLAAEIVRSMWNG
jgi:NTE family protein